MTTNPLLADNLSLPPFSALKTEHMLEAVQQVINSNRAAIKHISSKEQNPSWDDIEQLEQLDNMLSKVWSPIAHLNSVLDSDDLRTAYDACLPLLSDYGSEVMQNESLYKRFVYLDEQADALDLDPVQRKLLKDSLRDFHLSGVDLPAEKKQRYADIRKRLSKLASEFDKNLLDATMAWEKHFQDAGELPGLPESALQAAAQAAKEKDKEGYLVTLNYPSYHAIMTYCDDRDLREEVYTAFCTRASDKGPHANKFDNSKLMIEILQLRQELANLLGYKDYIEYSLASKMASSEDEVVSFLEELAKKSLPHGKIEKKELAEFAREKHRIGELQSWDLAYYSEKLRLHKYAISQEQLRPYFPESRVVPGMFTLVEKLFQIRIKAAETSEIWHKDAKYYEIYDGEQHIASFYLDLYARAKKRGGAWMADYQSRLAIGDSLQLPVAFLTCNFSSPTDKQEALFTHDEVTTLFHEFGHGLHHMLTKINHLQLAGINGVPWDAVELPSQFMENFCWHKESLALFSGHVESGEILPDELLDKMLAAKNFQSALQMLRQLEFALFDLKTHACLDKNPDIQGILDGVRKDVAVFIPPSFNRFQHGFSHIFSGGYAAGYYSYKWAEVLSADAFSRFEEEGILNQQVGIDFKTHILEKGGSAEPEVLFEAFRGRKPTIDALLRHCGIISD